MVDSAMAAFFGGQTQGEFPDFLQLVKGWGLVKKAGCSNLCRVGGSNPCQKGGRLPGSPSRKGWGVQPLSTGSVGKAPQDWGFSTPWEVLKGPAGMVPVALSLPRLRVCVFEARAAFVLHRGGLSSPQRRL